MPLSIHDLMQCPIIGFDRESSIRRLKDLGGFPLSRELFAFRCDSDVGQFAALKAGVGFGMCQYPLARRYRDLVSVLPGAIEFELDVWIAMHEDLKTSRRMRLMFDHLAKEMAAYTRPPPKIRPQNRAASSLSRHCAPPAISPPNKPSPTFRGKFMSQAAEANPAKSGEKPNPPLASFNWQDPLLLDGQLTDEERGDCGSARAYCEEKLFPA